MPIFANYEDVACEHDSLEDFMRESIAEERKADAQANNELMTSFIMHQQKKASRRYNRFKRRTSSRDRRGTLKAQYWEHCYKMYLRGDRRKRLYVNKMNEVSPCFMVDIYDVDKISDAIIDQNQFDVDDFVSFELMEPWYNDALVLYVLDECSKRFVHDECLSMRSIFELETLRTYFELGKCRICINPDFSEHEDSSMENFFRLVIDKDACELLSDITYKIFLCKLATRLYELHKDEKLHGHYLQKMQAWTPFSP